MANKVIGQYCDSEGQLCDKLSDGNTGQCRASIKCSRRMSDSSIRNIYSNASGETGIAPVDTTVSKIVAWEQSKLSNPLVQVALLGLAAYGTYVLIDKFVLSKS